MLHHDEIENDWTSWKDGMESYISLCSFSKIDILNYAVPVFPFRNLPAIVERARKIIHKRSPQEVLAAAQHLRWVINCFFHQYRNEMHRRYKLADDANSIGAVPYIDKQSGALKFKDIGPTSAKEVMEFLNDYPQPTNTSELEVLQKCIDDYLLDIPGFTSSNQAEYFAILALWLVVDCIDRFGTDLDLTEKNNPNGIEADFLKNSLGIDAPVLGVVLSGNQESEALKAIAYAEKLLTSAEIESVHRRKADELVKATESRATREIQFAIQNNAKKAAKARHATTAALEKLAVELYLDHMKKWDLEHPSRSGKQRPSKRAVSKIICPQIVAEGIIQKYYFSPDRVEKTVYDWILKSQKNVVSE